MTPRTGRRHSTAHRRIAIDYLRQNLHELRPYEIQRTGSATRPARRN